jgi:hypothetical protein
MGGLQVLCGCWLLSCAPCSNLPVGRACPQFDPAQESDRLLLVKVLLHAADIGNAVRPYPVNNCMSQRVHLEFQVSWDNCSLRTSHTCTTLYTGHACLTTISSHSG